MIPITKDGIRELAFQDPIVRGKSTGARASVEAPKGT